MIDADSSIMWTTFTEQQLADGWLEWIGRNPERLNEFYTEVPDLPADRYSVAALRVAERCLLTRFSGSGPMPGLHAVDLWGCFLGEVLVHSLHGQWFNAPAADQVVRPTVLFPYTALRVRIVDWVHRALRICSGGVWTGLYAGLADLCDEWWYSGCCAPGDQPADPYSDYRRGQR